MIVWRVMLVIAAVVATTGCERTFRDMYDQPRYKPLAASPLWPDGRASRPPVTGTVARYVVGFRSPAGDKVPHVDRRAVELGAKAP